MGVVDGTGTGPYGVGNACMWCHKSRKDVTNYITASNTLSTYWGPHEGPQTDIFTGEGGYHYSGKTYNNSSHQALKKGCVSCHMGPVATNEGIGNHSFAPQVATCNQAGCHAAATSFDVLGRQTAMLNTLRQVRDALNTKGWLTAAAAAPYDALTPAQVADANFKSDKPRGGGAALTAAEAGALYNYLLIARGGAGGIHNPLYVSQLMFDSYVALTGNPPSTMVTRPAP